MAGREAFPKFKFVAFVKSMVGFNALRLSHFCGVSPPACLALTTNHMNMTCESRRLSATVSGLDHHVHGKLFVDVGAIIPSQTYERGFDDPLPLF